MGTWSVQNGELYGKDGYGVAQWTPWADLSVRAEQMYGDRNKFFRLHFFDSSNYMNANFRSVHDLGGSDDINIIQVVDGQGQAITKEFQFGLPYHNYWDPQKCRIDVIGQHIIAYFNDQIYIDQEFSNLLVQPGLFGTEAFSMGSHYDNYQANEAAFATTFLAQVTRGQYLSGGPFELQKSDNNSYVLQCKSPIGGLPPQGQVVCTANAGTAALFELDVRLESKAEVTNVTQKAELLNTSTGLWETVDTRVLTTTDRVVRVSITNNPLRFVDPTSGDVKLRLSFSTSPGVGSAPKAYKAYLDEVRFVAIKS